MHAEATAAPKAEWPGQQGAMSAEAVPAAAEVRRVAVKIVVRIGARVRAAIRRGIAAIVVTSVHRASVRPVRSSAAECGASRQDDTEQGRNEQKRYPSCDVHSPLHCGQLDSIAPRTFRRSSFLQFPREPRPCPASRGCTASCDVLSHARRRGFRDNAAIYGWMATILATRDFLLAGVTTAALLSAGAETAHASCGAAFCTLMTDRYAQTTGLPHTGWSIDARLESIDQDRLMRGGDSMDASEAADEYEVERSTENTNLLTSLTYGLSAEWSALLRPTVVNRDHVHDVSEDGAASESERWQFDRLGDIQALVRRQFATHDGKWSYAVYGGLKLPTGTFDLANEDGDRALRALQPGTGTTDLLADVALRRALGLRSALLAQASASRALSSREGYAPGRRVELTGGWSHAFSQRVGTVVQVNYAPQRRQRAASRGRRFRLDDGHGKPRHDAWRWLGFDAVCLCAATGL